jgi:hypothetical protein
MKTSTRLAMVAAVGFILLGAPAAIAAPMRCSGEQKTCSTACLKVARIAPADCLAACHAMQQSCMHTGCWNIGTSRYCGLMKQ